MFDASNTGDMRSIIRYKLNTVPDAFNKSYAIWVQLLHTTIQDVWKFYRAIYYSGKSGRKSQQPVVTAEVMRLPALYVLLTVYALR